VFKFTAKGKFVDRFDVQGSNHGQISQASCIAVDGQGHVYVGGGEQVTIFSPQGQFIKSFETDVRVEKMAFSEQGDLYIVSGDTVSRYQLGELP
jgi:sugar lactone lactonase YvrE